MVACPGEYRARSGRSCGRWPQYASGLSVRFIANGTGIGVLWDQLSTEENSVNLSGIVRSGMDLYVREGEVWHWIGQAFPRPDMKQAQILVEGVSRKYRQYRLYLPLFSQVENLKVVVSQGEIRPMPPHVMAQRAPIVFYGTSITHGASASRPGLAYPAIIGRRLDYTVINA